MHNEKSLQEYYNGRGHFGLSFAMIRDYSNLSLNELALNLNVSIYDLKKEISLTLLSKNFFKYLKFIFKNFMIQLGYLLLYQLYCLFLH